MATKEFQMSNAQLATLLEQINSEMPLIALQVMPPGASLSERVNIAWDLLGEDMGFIGHTARPITGKGPQFFTAEVQE